MADRKETTLIARAKVTLTVLLGGFAVTLLVAYVYFALTGWPWYWLLVFAVPAMVAQILILGPLWIGRVSR